MGRGWAVMAVLSLAPTLLWAQGAGKFHAAGISQGGDIAYPMNTRTPGFVTLDVRLDSGGAVQNVSVVRDVPPLTSVAQSAVKNWQFTPATADGNGVPGTVRVTVAFNPYNPGGVGLPGESLQSPAGEAGGNYQPAGLQQANYANYPQNTVTSGTVVLRVHVGKAGKVGNVSAVQGSGALSDAAIAAAKTWVFAPARYQGKAIESEAVVAFVFASPQAGTR
jgi:TonB family protein